MHLLGRSPGALNGSIELVALEGNKLRSRANKFIEFAAIRMMRPNHRKLLIVQFLLSVGICLLFSVAPQAEEAVKKPVASPLQRLAARIELVAKTTAADFEVVWLGEGASKTLAVFEAPDSGPREGAVIVILGAGQLLEQSEFSTSIREMLASSGRATLIVQSEQLHANASNTDSAAIVSALLTSATAHVNSKGYSNIVVVAYGQVAQNLWPIIQSAPDVALGFVGIDEWFVEDFTPSIPVLNVVNRNLAKATGFAEKRFSSLKKKPSAPCELFFYDGAFNSDIGYGRVLSKRIRGWIERHFGDVS